MIGQEQLQKDLFSHTLADSRKTILFLGDYGCGKHTLASEYAKHLDIPLIDITDSISSEILDTIQFSPVLSMYLINLDNLTEQAQNIVLKFIEEPPASAYIVLLSSNENRVLPTVLNRCFKYKFAKYTREELAEIMGEDVREDILSVCTTPGQIRMVGRYYDDMVNFCSNIVGKLTTTVKYSAFSNALSISDRINYSDKYDKFDFDIFLKILRAELYNSYIKGDNIALKLYNIVCNESNKLVDTRLNKELFMQHLITIMWKTIREGLNDL